MAFQYLKGAYKQEGERLFMRVDTDRTRGNGFKLRQGRFRLDTRRKLFTQSVVTHCSQVAQGGCGCPIPGGIQGQAGCGSGQPRMLVGDPAHSRALELMSIVGLFNPGLSLMPSPFLLWNVFLQLGSDVIPQLSPLSLSCCVSVHKTIEQ